MKPLSIELINFQAHAHSTLDFTSLDFVTLLVGIIDGDKKRSNGAGKTSVIDALEWALCEVSRADQNKILTTDDLVREGQTLMSVVFVFESHDGNTYRVTRKYNKSNRKLAVTLEMLNGAAWKTISKDSTKETNKEIIARVGAEHSVLKSSILCKQHEVAGIVGTGSADRLATIKKILPLGKYALYAEEAKKDIVKLQKELDVHSSAIEKADQASKANVELKNKLDLAEQKLKFNKTRIETQNTKVEEIRVKIEESNKLIGGFEQLQQALKTNEQRYIKLNEELKRHLGLQEQGEKKLETLREEAKQHKTRIIEIENLKPDKTRLVNEYQALSEKRELAQQQAGKLAAMLEAITVEGRAGKAELDQIKALGVGKCKLCKNEVTADHLHVTIESQEARLKELRERAQGIHKELEVNKKALSDLQKQIDELKKQEVVFNNLIEEKNRLGERMKALQELGTSIKDSIANYTQQIAADKVEVEKISKEQAALQKKSGSINFDQLTAAHKNLVSILQQAVALQTSINQEVAQLTAESNVAKAQIVANESLITASTESLKQLEALRTDIKLLEQLRIDFIKTIPTMILENSSSMIEEEANKCLAALSDGFSISISTQHKNKTNDGITEVFDIIVHTPQNGSRPIELLSGGEKFRVAFAIRIALSLILAQQSGIKMDIMLYDEPFIDLDDDGIEKIQEIFLYLSKVFRHQIAITHTAELKETFNDVIVVEKITTGASAGSTISHIAK